MGDTSNMTIEQIAAALYDMKAARIGNVWAIAPRIARALECVIAETHKDYWEDKLRAAFVAGLRGDHE